MDLKWVKLMNNIVRFIPGIVLVCFALSGCDSGKTEVEIEPPLRLVKTYTIEAPTVAEWQEFSGVVDAAKSAEIGFRVAGKLISLNVGEGDQVTENQLLAKLDDTDFQIQLKARQAEYQQANGDYKRARKLVESGTISRSDFNKLEAQNATAEAALAAASQNLEYTVLRSPFSGRIAKRHVNNFEEVSALQTVFTLHDLSSLIVRANIPERIMINARRDARPTIQARFDSMPAQIFPLTVFEVATVADPGTNTYQVSFTMQNIKGHNILPGMSVTVQALPDPTRKPGSSIFTVPAQAVLEDDRGRYLYLARPVSDSIATVERRQVQTGKLSQSGLAILSGLEVGDRVIVAGMSKMVAGLKVRLDGE